MARPTAGRSIVLKEVSYYIDTRHQTLFYHLLGKACAASRVQNGAILEQDLPGQPSGR